MKKYLFLFIVSLVALGFGCQQADIEETAPEPIVSEAEGLHETIYTSFVINTHDWCNPELSIATLNRIIDLHEEYELPVDIYLDDQVVQIYEQQATDLIERLKSSPYVAVSYHLRPPYPYYGEMDFLELDDMSKDALTATILNYEEHRIDLSTGELLEEPGGYQYLKDLIGYAPYIVGSTGNSNKVRKVLVEIYKDKGAIFSVARNEGYSDFGDSQDGLWSRPEDFEVKVYEPRGHKAGEKFLLDVIEEVSNLPTSFVNLKWHENNFYTWFTPWGEVYYTDQNKTEALEPPFDLSKAGEGSEMKIADEQAEQWSRYEECLIYAKNHSEIFTVINARDLATMVK
ncbi:hypothetical protein KKH24_03620 [Patescibacteria group bacterium]|nr:hypothetical protein [Patescibacteria group bacterium]